MGADVMEFYKISRSGISPLKLMTDSSNYVGAVPPLWFATHNLFLQAFHVDLTYGSARFPDAMVGIIAVLIAFFMGKALAGRSAGLLAALFTAFQPLHIQMSRECYFYVPIVLGCMVLIWAVTHLADLLEKKRDPDVAFYILAFVGFYLTTNIQISSWTFAFIIALVMYAMLIPRAAHRVVRARFVVILTVGFFLLGVPSILSEWGVRDIISTMFGDTKEHWSEVFGAKKGGLHLFWSLWGMLNVYLFGRGWFRSTLGTAALLLGIWALVSRWKIDLKIRAFVWFALGTFMLLFISHSRSVYPEEARHYSSIFPILLVVVCLGMRRLGEQMADMLKMPGKKDAVVLITGVFLVLGVNAYPAWLSTRLVGSPPYTNISKWADRNLPPNTIVLCDRWLTAFNELKLNASTNVIYTFTVPSEPPRIAMENRWKETVVQYLKDNPFAARFGSMSPGTWHYGRFARRQEFVDEAAVKLGDMGLNYRLLPGEYPCEPERVAIFYNTEEDIIAAAKKANQTTLLAYGSNWGYMKPWQMTPEWSEQLLQVVWLQAGMFMERGQTLNSLDDLGLILQSDGMRYLSKGCWSDYRVATDNSQLRLFNLTDKDLSVKLILTAMAVTGPVSVSVGDAIMQFPPILLTSSTNSAILKPGENALRISAPPGQILLIKQAKIESASGV